MGNKTDHASTSKLRRALDFSIADPADSPILDDQTVSDTLETGAFHLSDHSTGDSRDAADKDVEDDGTTTRLDVLKARAMLDKITGGTTGRHRYQPSWAQRVLSWFKSRFGQSDLR